MSNSTKKEHRRFLKKIRVGDLVTWGNSLSSHSILEIKPDGVLVDLGDDNTSDTYQWYQKNDNLGVIPGDTFPMKVKIKYHHLVQSCVASKGEIEISALKIVK